MEYITPERAKELGDKRPIEQLHKLATSHYRPCQCGQPVWRFAGCGMCFGCTTGESDDSEDYELIPSNKEPNP